MTSIPASSGIYKITCNPTGKFYIGSALNLRVRWMNHCSQLRRNVHHNITLQRAWNKYGPDAFTFEILELVLIPELLTAREQYWFSKLQPFAPKGFNLDSIAGSRLGHTPTSASREKMGAAKRDKTLSPEHRAKISIAGLGNTHTLGHKATPTTRLKMSKKRKGKPKSQKHRENIGLSNLGHEVSKSTRAKLSQAHIGRVSDPEFHAGQMKTLIVTDPSGNEYIVTGLRRFCREHNLDASHLRCVAQEKAIQHKGWTACYPEAAT